MPAVLSTKVVTGDVPNTAPIDVATVSASKAFSILVFSPFPFPIAFSSSRVNIPALRPVPIKVPIVSKISVSVNAKIVISMSAYRDGSANRDPSPCEPNAAPKVVPSSPNADRIELDGLLNPDKSVTPMGIPITVVKIIPIKMAPLTLATIIIIVTTKPISASSAYGLVKLPISGIIPPPVTTVLTAPLISFPAVYGSLFTERID